MSDARLTLGQLAAQGAPAAPVRSTGRDDPSIFDALGSHVTAPLDRDVLADVAADARRWTRRYLFPWIRLLSQLLIPLILAVKRCLPALGSERALSVGTLLFARHFVGPEAQRLFLRHFATEANVINFVARNSGAPIPESDLYPRTIHELGDWNGKNAIALHDANVTNAMIDLGADPRADVTRRRALGELDFSMLQVPRFEADQSRTWLGLDLHSAVYVALLFIVLFFDDRTLERAINSLQLDEGLMNAVADMTGDHRFRSWAIGKFPAVMGSPTGDVARELHYHMMLHEYAQHRLMQLAEMAERGVGLPS